MGELTVVIPVRDDVRVGRCLASFDEARAHPLIVMNDPTQEVISTSVWRLQVYILISCSQQLHGMKKKTCLPQICIHMYMYSKLLLIAHGKLNPTGIHSVPLQKQYLA